MNKLLRLSLLGVALNIAATVARTEEVGLTAIQAEGKQAFHAHCGYCHLESGTGTMMLGRRLGKENELLEKRVNLEAVYVKSIVRTGLMSMPPITRVEVTDKELEAIAAYLTRGNPAERDGK